MRRLVFASAALLVLTATAASAAEGKFIHPADTNHDQRIDKAEWVAAKMPAADFAKADKNHDGKIDGPEFVGWSQSQAK